MSELDFGKGAVNVKSGKKTRNVFGGKRKSTSKRRSGTKARAVFKNEGTVEIPEWIWYAQVEDKLLIIDTTSLGIPFENKGTDKAPRYMWKVIDLYCNPTTNSTYPEWFKKKDRSLRPKDKHQAKVINTYWSTIKPNMVIFGDIKEDVFYLNQ